MEQILHLPTLKSLTPSPDRCKAYGNDQIHKLSCWFQINYENTLKSWSHFKNLVVAYNKSSSDELISLALSLEEIKGIHILLETYQTLVLTTNDCERTFSIYNNIHIDSRSSLDVETVNHLINIHMNGPKTNLFHFASN